MLFGLSQTHLSRMNLARSHGDKRGAGSDVLVDKISERDWPNSLEKSFCFLNRGKPAGL